LGRGAQKKGSTGRIDEVMGGGILNEGDLGSEKKKKKRGKSAKHTMSPDKKKNLEKRITEIKSTSRWLPDTAMTTYFGKPAFHPYGNGNTKPVVGGTIYG